MPQKLACDSLPFLAQPKRHPNRRCMRDWAETADKSIQMLIGSQVSDILGQSDEAIFSHRLRWCSLWGLGPIRMKTGSAVNHGT
jgi:hypothetical protein